MELLPCIELETTPNPTAAVIWLHGLGADGNDFIPIIPELNLAGCLGIRFVFPSAPSIPVTLNGGHVMPAWYDIIGRSLMDQEDAAGIKKSAASIVQLIEREASRGIAYENIVPIFFLASSLDLLSTTISRMRTRRRIAFTATF